MRAFPPPFHNYLLCTHYMPGTAPATGCPGGMKPLFLILGELRSHEEADCKPVVPCSAEEWLGDPGQAP